jgi:hypothetical protein
MESLPACSVAISASTGAIALQGPHHSAQKSTRIGVSDDLMVSSKFPVVKVRIDCAMMFVLLCSEEMVATKRAQHLDLLLWHKPH